PEPRSWDIAGRTVRFGRDETHADVLIADDRASRRHATLAPSPPFGVHRLTDDGSKNGTFLNGKRLQGPERVRDGDVLRVGDALFVYEAVDAGGIDLSACPSSTGLRHHQTLVLADRSAPTELPVLITGPTGAGKELIAARIHERSGRKGAFVPINCAALSPELLASELFGHVKGAFSGAGQAREGLFRAAEGGTLLLDEIGDMPSAQQPALLRVLQEGKVRPLGADREHPVDVRVVAATHQDLATRARTGQFREDLWARLATLTVPVAPLRTRRVEVLPTLLSMSRTRSAVSVGAAEALLTHAWPRNHRELQQLAAHLDVLVEPSPRIERAHLPADLRAQTLEPVPSEQRPSKASIEAALAREQGNVAAVARVLDVHRNQLYRWLDAYGIDARRFRG
ncbi:MAG: sigma 54-interacting transcriptional regulator, partial [Myxococcota bacterium]